MSALKLAEVILSLCEEKKLVCVQIEYSYTQQLFHKFMLILPLRRLSNRLGFYIKTAPEFLTAVKAVIIIGLVIFVCFQAGGASY